MACSHLTGSPEGLARWGCGRGGEKGTPHPGAILRWYLINFPRRICIPTGRETDAAPLRALAKGSRETYTGKSRPAPRALLALPRLAWLIARASVCCFPAPLPPSAAPAAPRSPAPRVCPPARTQRRTRPDGGARPAACLPLGASPPGAARRRHLAAGDGTAPRAGQPLRADDPMPQACEDNLSPFFPAPNKGALPSACWACGG